MVESIVTRTTAKSIAGDWERRATDIVAKSVYPALDRQIAPMEQLKPTTRAGDGAWRLPNGGAIYAEALRQATTTNFTPDEVHQMGLAQVAEISAEIDKILQGAGLYAGHGRRAARRAQQGPVAALCRDGCRPCRAARRPECRCEGHVRATSGTRSRRCPRSRWRSAASRRKSRTARRTAITAARRSMARVPPSTSST